MSARPPYHNPSPDDRPVHASGRGDDKGRTTSPFDDRQALATASNHLQTGQAQQAERICRQILARNPRHPGGLHLLGLIALGARRPGVAEQLIRQAIAADSTNADYHADLGGILMVANRPEEGVAALKQAIGLKPSHIGANYNLGLFSLQTGDLDAAKRHLERVTRKAPDNIDALIALGVTLARQRQPAKAAQIFRKVLTTVPGHPQVLRNLGTALMDLGEYRDALAKFEELLKNNPDSAAAHFHVALALTSIHDRKTAIKHYKLAIKLEPDYADAHNNLAVLLMAQGRLHDALRHFEIARSERPRDTYLIRNIAEILLRLNRNQEAIQAFRRLIEMGDNREEACEGIVIALRQEGRFEEAEHVLDDLLASLPKSVLARCVRASSGARRLSDRDIEVLETSADDRTLDASLRASVSFALGKAYADRHDDDRAFAHYRTANAIVDETMVYDPDADDAAVAESASVFSPELFDRFVGLGSPDERPVFVFGMPRSGTTLIEQIVASHPDARGGGELVDMLEIPHDLEERLDDDVTYPRCLAQLTGDAFAEAAARYLKTLDLISTDAKRITDKMPENYRRLGLISLLLPRAKLIHCRRDPRATCLSIFFQNFAELHEYAYDLYKIGRRYRNYLQLMELWRRVLPIPIFEIAYENVIADLEGNCRRLLTFCDLPWHERVLRFYDTSRSVQTVSLWQVRQPLYESSVAVWRRYEKFLEPLERGLRGEPA